MENIALRLKAGTVGVVIGMYIGIRVTAAIFGAAFRENADSTND